MNTIKEFKASILFETLMPSSLANADKVASSLSPCHFSSFQPIIHNGSI